ncbi:MAG: MauE/DoxX family redox-associated membrane protein, partial [Acidimicrobiales bacterium]
MAGLGYTAALLLAAVLGWAGVAKLGRRELTGRRFGELGLPAPGTLAVAVPAGEIGLAAGLVVAPGWTAAATIAVLAGFTTVLVRALRQGAAVGCGCFGAAADARLSPVSVARNALLAVAAGVALAADRPVWPHPG